MKAPSRLIVVRHLVEDTFRQARASGIGAMMLVVTAICTVLCLSVSISGDVSLHDDKETVYFLPASSARSESPLAGEPGKQAPLGEIDPTGVRREGIETIRGRLSLAFGALSIPVSRERADAVHLIELLLGSGIAGTFGILLALLWTAGFAPTFLEPRAASVLLSKPVARWQLLAGKYLGVLSFVGLHAVVFVGATWLALGVRTHVWDPTYLWVAPLLLTQFATYYSFSLFIAVLTRSTVASVFGSVLFWLLAWGLNYGCVMIRATHVQRGFSPGMRLLAEAAYWGFPKPIDSGLILFNALDAHQHFAKPAVFMLLESSRSFSPFLSMTSSVVPMLAFLALAAHEFEAADY